MIDCGVLPTADAAVGLDNATPMRKVALATGLIALALVEAAAQLGTVGQRIRALPGLRLLGRGSGPSARGNLALALRHLSLIHI